MTVSSREEPPSAKPAASRQTAQEALSSLASNRETGLTGAQAQARLARDGANEVAEKGDHPILRFARKFWGLSAWMIELIVVLSFALGKFADLWIGLALLVVNAVLSFVQEQRGSAAVAALRRRLPVTARVLRDGAWQAMSARLLVAGDVVRLRAGDFVPADAIVLDGELQVDQSALTGESVEVSRTADGALYSGSLVRQGEATAIVVATGVRTYFGRTTEIVQSAHPKLHVEEVVGRVVKWLFWIVGVQVAVALAVSVASRLNLLDMLPLALVLLMSAVPVALPVMFTVSMAVGSMELARHGVLVTRLAAAEDAANMDILCADKTGTLTVNRLSLAGALPQPGFTEDEVVRAGALASNESNQDPIDLALLRAAQEKGLLDPSARTLSFTPFSPKTRRIEARVDVGGVVLSVMKGALRSVAQAVALEPSELAALEALADEQGQKGFRVLAVARAQGGESSRLVGLALLHDTPRPDSKGLIERLRGLGVGVKMLTGDALPVAREVARELGLPEIVRAAGSPSPRVSDPAIGGLAEVFPEDKFRVVESLQASGHVVGMTGDGVNDAPALRQAEVGIAVADATDVAKGAASVVLTTEGLSGIVDLVRNGRAIYQRVLTWIVNKISRTILKSGFVVVALLATRTFVISALGMVLLVFMTDFAKIALSTDRTRPSQKPESWSIGPLVKLGAGLGLLMLAEALGFLTFAWHRFGLDRDAGRRQTFAFALLLFFAVFSIASIRERRRFWASRPSWPLTLALAAEAAVGLAICARGLAELAPLPLGQSAAIVGYAALCCLGVNDAVKTAFLR